MKLRMSAKTRAKLAAKHGVSEDEVLEAFADRPGYVVIDERADHASDPPTFWFIASTNSGRILKVCYVQRGEDVYLRTAYPANATEIAVFNDAE